MSGDLSHGSRENSNLGRILAFIAMGFTLVLVGIFIARAITPSGATATALFEVSNVTNSVFEPQRLTLQEFDILKKTQMALLKSNFVLSSALRRPAISSLNIFGGVEDPVKWLQDNLVVEFPQNGELLSISLTSNELPEDLVHLVDAVSKAYKDEVVNELRQRRLSSRDLLARNLENINKEVKRKFEEYLDIAKETGKFVGSNGELLQQIYAKQLDRIEEEIIRLESSLAVEIGDDGTKKEATRLRVEQLVKQKNELTADLKSRVERDADLETREEELKQLQQIANEMSVKLERLDIEASTPDQIRQVQPAVVARN